MSEGKQDSHSLYFHFPCNHTERQQNQRKKFLRSLVVERTSLLIEFRFIRDVHSLKTKLSGFEAMNPTFVCVFFLLNLRIST